MVHYEGDSYYQNLFKHFEENLKSSDLLIVIGYGFQDPGINDYLEKHFLTVGKKMVVIDPKKPNSVLIDKYKITHIKKSIIDVSYEELLDLTR